MCFSMCSVVKLIAMLSRYLKGRALIQSQLGSMMHVPQSPGLAAFMSNGNGAGSIPTSLTPVQEQGNQLYCT